MTLPFDSVLVANRGEIAARVMRTAKRLGLRRIAVYSEADAEAYHVRAADVAVCIGPPPAAASYLSIEAVIEAARRTGAQAIHPGYGFLSENAEFARACRDADLVFIGPSPDAIRAMGDKARAKQLMREAGVPCVPGYDGEDQSDDRLQSEAEAIGYPLLVKASAGGGGRGMRRVDDPGALSAALAAARSEAKSAFGDDTLLLEKLVTDARHVEVQVFGDRHGHAIHLGERDCSAQRRHQKVIEESPSPAVDAALRERMGAAATAAARAIDYEGAGTVEFLLGPDGEFYFLEMNTRLQVEHPVTELVTGLDLVELQLRVAAGETLGLQQADVDLKGHAIEVRLYAEDPYEGFAPQTGRLGEFRTPRVKGVRVDRGVTNHSLVTPHYDPMLAKVIAHGDTREQARERLIDALASTNALGVTTNRHWLTALLADEQFVAGAVTTDYVEAEFEATRPALDPVLVSTAAIVFAEGPRRHVLEGWRNSGSARFPIRLRIGVETVDCQVDPQGDGGYRVTHAGETRTVRWLGPLQKRRLHHDHLEIDGNATEIFFAWADGALGLRIGNHDVRIEEVLPLGDDSAVGSESDIVAPTSGRVVAVLVSEGESVEPGTVAVKIEAMKIESSLTAEVTGTVRELRVAEGQQVEAGQLLVALEPVGQDTPPREEAS